MKTVTLIIWAQELLSPSWNQGQACLLPYSCLKNVLVRTRREQRSTQTTEIFLVWCCTDTQRLSASGLRHINKQLWGNGSSVASLRLVSVRAGLCPLQATSRLPSCGYLQSHWSEFSSCRSQLGAMQPLLKQSWSTSSPKDVWIVMRKYLLYSNF